ncbi:selenium metabolism-associated LysR family transcriptional regulator [Anaerobranca gottschalkii]|uniref:DNA-binding transcriptional regulator, LysR family n=1 Tax=Anaerobranca gottschalkii DSM 13577 TaxID=1120990 RepID=A0A1I0BK79_9FIRM|nr:selenium metabolism-associated LysR family transcriptional regulator [Anaerobranca gottschalkii]SET07335.1 DNA-binding transcriptional regulator, LysR family [Anaerobranca gottschalkii DSM 13577]
MNLNLLKTFITVVEEGNFSKAAQKLHLSQPAVSMQMQTLAQELEIDLFLKVGKKVQLTEGGVILYKEGKVLLENWQNLLTNLDNFKNQLSGKLRIGASTIPGLYYLPKRIKKFKELYPKTDFIINIDHSGKIIEELVEGEIDLAFVGKRVNKAGISSCKWMKDNLVLIKPKGLPLISQMTVKDLQKYPLIIRKEGSATRALMEEKLKEKGIKLEDLDVVLELDSTESVIASVEAGIGLSFVSEIAAAKYIQLGTIEIVPIDLDLSRDLFYAFRSDRIHSNLLESFLLHLEQRG